MSNNRSNKKKVSFLEKGESRNVNKINKKKGSILKSKSKIKEEEKVMQPIEEKNERSDKNDKNKIEIKREIKREEPITIDNKNIKKKSPADEYFKLTIQNVLQEGLLNIAMIHPKDPIRFLGNFLIEKSKNTQLCKY